MQLIVLVTYDLPKATQQQHAAFKAALDQRPAWVYLNLTTAWEVRFKIGTTEEGAHRTIETILKGIAKDVGVTAVHAASCVGTGIARF